MQTVSLPDGNSFQFPDGMSPEAMQEAIHQHLGTSQPKQEQPSALAKAGKDAYGGLEAAGSTALGLPGYIAGGLGGLGRLITSGGDINKAVESQQQTQELLTKNKLFDINPQTESGKTAQEALGKGFEFLSNKAGDLGEAVAPKGWESTGRMGGEVLGNALMNFAPLPVGKGIAKVAKPIENALSKFKKPEVKDTKPNISSLDEIVQKIREPEQLELPLSSSVEDIAAKQHQASPQGDLFTNPVPEQSKIRNYNSFINNGKTPLPESPLPEIPKSEIPTLPEEANPISQLLPNLPTDKVPLLPETNNTFGKVPDSPLPMLPQEEGLKNLALQKQYLELQKDMPNGSKPIEINSNGVAYTVPKADVFSPSFRDKSTFTGKNGDEFTMGVGGVEPRDIGNGPERQAIALVKDKEGAVIARADIVETPQGMQVQKVNVVPEAQRNGIATEIYKQLGKYGEIVPDVVQTPEGQALWKALEAQRKAMPLGHPARAELTSQIKELKKNAGINNLKTNKQSGAVDPSVFKEGVSRVLDFTEALFKKEEKEHQQMMDSFEYHRTKEQFESAEVKLKDLTPILDKVTALRDAHIGIGPQNIDSSWIVNRYNELKSRLNKAANSSGKEFRDHIAILNANVNYLHKELKEEGLKYLDAVREYRKELKPQSKYDRVYIKEIDSILGNKFDFSSYSKRTKQGGNWLPFATNKRAADVAAKVPGLNAAQRMYNTPRTAEEAKQAVLGQPDAKPIGELSHATQAGIRLEGIRTDAPLTKWLNHLLSNEALPKAKSDIGTYVKPLAQQWIKLTKEDRGHVYDIQKKGDLTGTMGREFTPEELSKARYNDKVIKFVQDSYADKKNQASIGTVQGPLRQGYVSHDFPGNYQAIVLKDGRPMLVLDTKTRGEMDLARQHAMEKYPSAVITKTNTRPINVKGEYSRNDVSISDLIKAAKENDGLSASDIKALDDLVDMSNNHKLFGQDKHDQARANYTIEGYAGNKPWLSKEQNIKDAFESQIRSSERAYYTAHTEKAMDQAKAILNDPEVVDARPNAVANARQNLDRISGTKIWGSGRAVGDLTNFIAERLGGGKTHIKAANAIAMTLNQAMNISFSLWNVGQNLMDVPLKGIPKGIEAAKVAGVNPLEAPIHAGVQVAQSFKNMLDGKGDTFTKNLQKYMEDQHIISYSEVAEAMDATKGPVIRGIDKATRFLPEQVDIATRVPVMLSMSGVLKAGWEKTPSLFKNMDDLFHTAKDLTQTAMVDYDPIQRQLMYQKAFGPMAGPAGQFRTYVGASTSNLITQFKSAPLAATLAVVIPLYLFGLKSIPGEQEADNLFYYITSKLGNPMHFPDLIENAPKLAAGISKYTMGIFNKDNLAHGQASLFTKVDLENKMAVSPLLPQLDPTKSAGDNIMNGIGNQFSAQSNIADKVGGVFNAVSGAIEGNSLKTKGGIVQAMPNAMLKGFAQNKLLTKDGMVINPKNGNNMYQRDSFDTAIKNSGATSLKEALTPRQDWDTYQKLELQKETQKQIINEFGQLFTGGEMTQEKMTDLQNKWEQAGGTAEDLVKEINARPLSGAMTQHQRNQGLPTDEKSARRYMEYNR